MRDEVKSVESQIHELWVPDGLRNHPGRPMRAIKSITIHTTGNHNATATAEAHARFQYTGGGGRQASWHYTVDADEIWQSFRDGQMCWHTGTGTGNETSIGIEICVNSRSGFCGAVKRSAQLTAYLLKKHGLGIRDVVQHHHWTRKNCPAELRSNIWGISWADFMVMTERYLQSGPAALDEEKAESVIAALMDARISFHEDHWRSVLKGAAPANREWTKILTNRIIDSRWGHFTPEVIGNSIMALLRYK